MTRKAPSLRIALTVAIAALVLAVALVPSALAGQGGNGGSSSISLVVLNSPDGLPHFGGQVTFNITTSATKPWVNVSCYQNGGWVYGQWHGFWDGYQYGRIFTLGPTPAWTSGEADCIAKIATISKNGRETTLATTSFHAYA